MMSATIDQTLADRLKALTGTDGACCVGDLQADAAALRQAPAFGVRLARLKALADENRLLIVLLLQRRGEMCGCELQAALGLTHATVSHHVAQLGQARLIESERRGRWIHYRLVSGAEADIKE